MKKIISLYLGLLCGWLSISAYAESSNITLMQNTSTSNTIALVCNKGQIMAVQGDKIQILDFASVNEYALGATVLPCTLTVTGWDQSLKATIVDGGTLTINLDPGRQQISVSDIKFTNPVMGLYWLDRGGQLSRVTGNFSLN